VKRTPLKRTTALARGTSQLKRTRLNPVSKRRSSKQRARREFVLEVLARHRYCEAGHLILSVDDRHRCQVYSTDVHEVKTRARGGDILDYANVKAVCRACHDWVHYHPAVATNLGLLASQYETRDD
jgi:hypothetical protein